MKKELEEAAHEYFKRGQLGFEKASDTEEAFLRGGLWQAERMYSEEEILVLLQKRDKHNIDNLDAFDGWKTPKEWFEQFKKKA